MVLFYVINSVFDYRVSGTQSLEHGTVIYNSREREFGTMIQIAVCDDEEFYLQREAEIIQNYMKENKICCEIDLFQDGNELLKEIGNMEKDYTILFLDVEMKEINGIQTAEKIREQNSRVFIIFVTAYLSYSMEGYKVDAIRYILKDEKLLEKAVIESLKAVFRKIEFKSRKQTFSFVEGKQEIYLEDILYIESSLHKLFFYVRQNGIRKFSLYEKLDKMEKELKDAGFCRIHKSFLVNLKYVEEINSYRMILANGSQLNISRTNYVQVKDELLIYRSKH